MVRVAVATVFLALAILVGQSLLEEKHDGFALPDYRLPVVFGQGSTILVPRDRYKQEMSKFNVAYSSAKARLEIIESSSNKLGFSVLAISCMATTQPLWQGFALLLYRRRSAKQEFEKQLTAKLHLLLLAVIFFMGLLTWMGMRKDSEVDQLRVRLLEAKAESGDLLILMEESEDQETQEKLLREIHAITESISV